MDCNNGQSNFCSIDILPSPSGQLILIFYLPLPETNNSIITNLILWPYVVILINLVIVHPNNTHTWIVCIVTYLYTFESPCPCQTSLRNIPLSRLRLLIVFLTKTGEQVYERSSNLNIRKVLQPVLFLILLAQTREKSRYIIIAGFV